LLACLHSAEKRDFERFFQGFGEITEVKLMAGFAFVEFKEPRDAKDAVSGRLPSFQLQIANMQNLVCPSLRLN